MTSYSSIHPTATATYTSPPEPSAIIIMLNILDINSILTKMKS